MTVQIRRIESRDEPRWRELWDAYTRYYEKEPSEAQTRYTWGRLLDAAAPIWAIVAEDSDDGVIGIANYLVHESTSPLTPVCYLEDRNVHQPRRRGGGG